MTMPLRETPKRFTIEEYLRRERASETKHEYDDGEILAMAGGSRRHSQIATNVTGSLWSRLRGGPCVPYNSDLRVRLPGPAKFVYPDVSIIGGPAKLDPDDSAGETVTNPRVIIEVLSPSTERYDRKEKFDRYREMRSLEGYVLVEQDEPRVEVFERTAEGTWSFLPSSGIEAVCVLRCLGIDLPLSEVYAGVTFAPIAAEPPPQSPSN